MEPTAILGRHVGGTDVRRHDVVVVAHGVESLHWNVGSTRHVVGDRRVGDVGITRRGDERIHRLDVEFTRVAAVGCDQRCPRRVAGGRRRRPTPSA